MLMIMIVWYIYKERILDIGDQTYVDLGLNSVDQGSWSDNCRDKKVTVTKHHWTGVYTIQTEIIMKNQCK